MGLSIFVVNFMGIYKSSYMNKPSCKAEKKNAGRRERERHLGKICCDFCTDQSQLKMIKPNKSREKGEEEFFSLWSFEWQK